MDALGFEAVFVADGFVLAAVVEDIERFGGFFLAREEQVRVGVGGEDHAVFAGGGRAGVHGEVAVADGCGL